MKWMKWNEILLTSKFGELENEILLLRSGVADYEVRVGQKKCFGIFSRFANDRAESCKYIPI